jgi:hypothetical protein
MKINKTFIVTAAVLIIFAYYGLSRGEPGISDHVGENVLYLVNPLGESEYNDLGVVDLKGRKVNLLTFRTKVLFFEDTEKIYSDPDTLLPIKVEREISNLWIKEYITEEYDQKNFTVTLKKFKEDKIIFERTTKANGSIHNVIALLFYMRNVEGLKIGWQFAVRMPNDEFKIELVSIDEITIPAGKFQTYHLKTIPDKAEIWGTKNDPRVLPKIQGKGILGYIISMKKYIPHKPR